MVETVDWKFVRKNDMVQHANKIQGLFQDMPQKFEDKFWN